MNVFALFAHLMIFQVFSYLKFYVIYHLYCDLALNNTDAYSNFVCSLCL